MSDTTTTVPNVEQPTLKAAEELIAVTGDKTIGKLWDLADAVHAAAPTLDRSILEAIRAAAITKAGHDDFWTVQRLRQLGRTARSWPKADRVPDVSVDAHMEALKAKDPKATLEKIAKANNGKVSIRDVRDAIGANGGKQKNQPPRIDRASPEQVFDALVGRQGEIRDFLRGQLKRRSAAIAELAAMFTELHQKATQAAQPTQAETRKAPEKPKATTATAAKKAKGRVKGI